MTRNHDRESSNPGLSAIVIGNRIKAALEERGMPRKELARQTGIAVSTISRFISGVRRPSARTMGTIASCLHLDVAYLMGQAPPSGMDPAIEHFLKENWVHTTHAERRALHALVELIDDRLKRENGKTAES
ncbi:MAG: helix-turn-helix transcriptional regulator [Dehalococcoidales bacterium]|nr:helix-turn-helix transcriptional regulator [Dehalococcoidales bacterium]